MMDGQNSRLSCWYFLNDNSITHLYKNNHRQIYQYITTILWLTQYYQCSEETVFNIPLKYIQRQHFYHHKMLIQII